MSNSKNAVAMRLYHQGTLATWLVGYTCNEEQRSRLIKFGSLISAVTKQKFYSEHKAKRVLATFMTLCGVKVLSYDFFGKQLLLEVSHDLNNRVSRSL